MFILTLAGCETPKRRLTAVEKGSSARQLASSLLRGYVLQYKIYCLRLFLCFYTFKRSVTSNI